MSIAETSAPPGSRPRVPPGDTPVSHLVTAERALMAGQAAAGRAAWGLVASAALAAAFAPVTVYLYGRQR